jgi:hypothetical protein
VGNYLCILLGLLQPAVGVFGPSILWVAVKVHRDHEAAFYNDPQSFLPLHCRGYPIVDSKDLFEVHVHAPDELPPAAVDTARESAGTQP